jgi:hypothetical protein
MLSVAEPVLEAGRLRFATRRAAPRDALPEGRFLRFTIRAIMD